VRLAGAAAVLSYVDGPAPGGPAVTRHERGSGVAWYVSTRLADADLGRLLERVYAGAGLGSRPAVPSTVELVARPPFLFAINHGGEAAEVRGTAVPAGEVVVLRDH